MSLRTMFLRDKSGRPVGSLAISINSCNQVEYQLSVVNTKLDTFDRDLARGLALGRLVENPIVVRLPQSRLNLYNINRAVMTNLSRRKGAPSRAVKAARLWLKDNE